MKGIQFVYYFGLNLKETEQNILLILPNKSRIYVSPHLKTFGVFGFGTASKTRFGVI